MPSRRWTTRSGMLQILAVAGGMGLLLPFFVAAREAEHHLHLWLELGPGPGRIVHYAISSNEQTPFWPRYWRRLTGRSKSGRVACPRAEGRYVELCELEHPEMASVSP